MWPHRSVVEVKTLSGKVHVIIIQLVYGCMCVCLHVCISV